MTPRLERLLNLLLLLQRRPVVRAADLAAQFGVSKRTIYRDLDLLSAMGVPLAAMPGEGYSLVDGFYMPPLSFTSDEAKALFLAAKMLRAQASGVLAEAAALAVEKIAHALPDAAREEVEALADIIAFYRGAARFDLDQPHLRPLQTAIRERRVVHLHYHGYADEAPTEREVEPDELLYNDGIWYVSGYCRLRRDRRSFRVERILALRLLDETFTPRMVIPAPEALIDVRVRFAAARLRHVRERQHYGFVSETALDNGDALMHYRVSRLDEIRGWLLGWGAAAVTLEPEALRHQIREEAQTLISLLT